MPIATRTFRVFVSSTFEDLVEERNALQRDVFPKLHELCLKHGARFQAIDLRWGVREEAAADHRTMEICLAEIDRCQKTGIKPNFIVLLGERYGWRPVPARIPAAEFEKVRGAGVDGWYQRDDNAVPPEYLLKRGSVDQGVGRALRDAARAAGLPAEAMVKYEASATHQEILKGLEDPEHVFGFVRRGGGAEVSQLRKLLPTALEYGSLESLCAEVEARLTAVILSEVARFESRTALELEVEAHDRFASERARNFVGRVEVLREIEEYVHGADRRALVLHGASGSGKSAVMARASGGAARRFVGATPEASSTITLLRSLCAQLGAEDVPLELPSVVRLFQERLAVGTPVVFIDALDQLAESATWLPAELPVGCRVVVSTTGGVPAGARVVELEAMRGDEAGELLRLWLGEAGRTLQDGQRAKVLGGFGRCGLPLYLKLAFEEARRWRSFDEGILGEGLDGIIDVLFRRLSENANHGEVLVGRALGFLSAARYGLTEDEMIDVLSVDEEVWKDFIERARHAPPSRRLPVVVWSRLFLDLEHYLTERAAPGGTVVTWYHRQLSERVAPRHEALARYFVGQPNARKAAELVYQQRKAGLLDEATATLTDLNFVAAKCAVGLVLDLEDDYRETIALLPEAQPEIKEKQRHDERMSKYTRDLIACAKGEIEHPDIPESVPWSNERILAEAQRIQESLTPLAKLESFAAFVARESYPLIEFGARPGFVAQCAFNSAPAGPVHEAAQGLVRSLGESLALRDWPLDAVYVPKPALLRYLKGHTDRVTSVTVTPDGRRAVSGSDDTTLRVWDLEKGLCLRTLIGHESCVNSVSVAADGRRAVSGSSDATLRMWDLQTGACLRILEGHTDNVVSVSVTPDGRRAVSGSSDGTLRAWDLETGECIRTREALNEDFGERWEQELFLPDFSKVRVTPNGRQAVLGVGISTWVWDLETGEFGFPGDPRSAAISVTADGRWIMSAENHQLEMRDLERGVSLRKLARQGQYFSSVSVTPDGRKAVSGDGNTLAIWDLEKGAGLQDLDERTT